MKAKEIKDLSTNDIVDKVKLYKSDLDKLALGHSVSPIDNPMKIRVTRKTIARLITELNNRNEK